MQKYFVYLYRIQWKLFQIGKRGIAGTEIIHRYSYTKSAQFFKKSKRSIKILHCHIFRNLINKISWFQRIFFQGILAFCHKILIVHLFHRQVYRHCQIFKTCIVPLSQILTTFIQHMISQSTYQSAFFSRLYKFIRAYKTGCIRLPPCQSFGTCYLSTFQIDQRLEIHFYIIFFQSLGQFCSKRNLSFQPDFKIAVVKIIIIGSQLFCFVHSHVRIFY